MSIRWIQILLFTLTERVKTMARLILEAVVESFGGEKHELNCSEPLLGEKQTNNRAELSAAVIALSKALDRKIQIFQ